MIFLTLSQKQQIPWSVPLHSSYVQHVSPVQSHQQSQEYLPILCIISTIKNMHYGTAKLCIICSIEKLFTQQMTSFFIIRFKIMEICEVKNISWDLKDVCSQNLQLGRTRDYDLAVALKTFEPLCKRYNLELWYFIKLTDEKLVIKHLCHWTNNQTMHSFMLYQINKL